MTRLISVHRIATGSGRPALGDHEVEKVDRYGGPESGHYGHKGTPGSVGGSKPGAHRGEETKTEPILKATKGLINKALNDTEPDMHSLDIERGIIIDTETGEKIFDHDQGDAYTVEFPRDKLKNNISSHNHPIPKNYPEGNSFSDFDVIIAIDTKQVESRILTQRIKEDGSKVDVLYKINPKRDEYKISEIEKKTGKHINHVIWDIVDKVAQKQKQKNIEKAKSGTMTAEEILSQKWHKIWKAAVPEIKKAGIDLQYIRTESK